MLCEFRPFQNGSEKPAECETEFSAGPMIPEADVVNIRAIGCQYGWEELGGERTANIIQSEEVSDDCSSPQSAQKRQHISGTLFVKMPQP